MSEGSGQTWRVELGEEVDQWLAGLSPKGKAQAFRAIDLLVARGVTLRMPHSRKLDDGLWELRFRCEQTNRRVTYTIEPGRNIITLTTFRKQRSNERKEVQRAKNVLRRTHGGTP